MLPVSGVAVPVDFALYVNVPWLDAQAFRNCFARRRDLPDAPTQTPAQNRNKRKCALPIGAIQNLDQSKKSESTGSHSGYRQNVLTFYTNLMPRESGTGRRFASQLVFAGDRPMLILPRG